MYFTKQHELVRKLAREFAEKELTNEILDEVEESGTFPEEILYKMGKAGFFGIKTEISSLIDKRKQKALFCPDRAGSRF